MKLFLFSICLFALKTSAQVVFCPPGAEWSGVYNIFSANYATVNVKIKYTGDSLIATDTFKKLEHTEFFYNCNNGKNRITLIKQVGDTVFFRNQYTQHKWEILFNYAALPGQSWKTSYLDEVSTLKSYTVTVNIVDQVTENGKTIRRLHVTHSSAGTRMIGERYGWGFLFALNLTGCTYTDSYWFNQSLCYKDNAFGVKQFSGLGCDYQNLVNTEEFLLSKPQLIVKPNPTTGSNFQVLVQNVNDPGLQIHIYNSVGQLMVILENIIAGTLEIPLTSFGEGVYTLALMQRGQVVCTKKAAVSRSVE